MSKASDTEPNGLAYYLREVLFDEFKRNREDLEVKYRKNWNAFNSISETEWKKDEGKDWRSNTFIQVTKMKVLAAYSMVLDMFMQGGKIPFTLVPSPWDNVVLEDLPDDERESVEDTIDDAKHNIDQQFADCNADIEFGKCIMSGALYGETFAKGYVHEIERKGYKPVNYAPEGLQDPTGQHVRYEKYSEKKNAPAFRYSSVWNVFRDYETDDLQAGAGIIDREMMSAYDLNSKKGGPFWIDSAITDAIKAAVPPGASSHAGEDTDRLPPGMRDIKSRKKTIETLECWCRVPRSVAEDFEQNHLKGKAGKSSWWDFAEFENDGDEVEIVAVVADNEVVRYVRNEGKRLWYRAKWEDKLDHYECTGVADNVQDVQQVLNGMVRAFEDNIKLIANVIIAIKKRMLAPDALQDGIKPGEQIEIAEEVDDARKAIQQITIQDITGSLLNGIPMFERYADEGSMIPKIMQGVVAEKHKPDTLGEMNMLQQNSGRYLGSVIKNYDDGLVEPIVRDFFDYNMEDPEVQKGKGNFIAQALGFTSFQDRIMKLQKLLQFLGLTSESEILATEVKFRDLLGDVAKALDLDPDQVMKSTEEKQEEQEQAQAMAEQQQAEAEEMMAQQVELQQAADERDHEQDLEKENLKHAHDMEKSEQEFEQDIVKEAVGGSEKVSQGLVRV